MWVSGVFKVPSSIFSLFFLLPDVCRTLAGVAWLEPYQPNDEIKVILNLERRKKRMLILFRVLCSLSLLFAFVYSTNEF